MTADPTGGSSTFWTATAVIDRDRGRAAMVVCNEGRARVLRRSRALAMGLLAGDDPPG